MGSAQQIPRHRKLALLGKSVERARERLATDRASGTKHQSYVKALIRYNEFLMQEQVLVHLHEN
jgi:hypothetical protein